MLWVATTFVGSALLFAVQPMIARMLRPRLGGAPSVWTVSILFFQAALLAYLAVLFVAALRRALSTSSSSTRSRAAPSPCIS